MARNKCIIIIIFSLQCCYPKMPQYQRLAHVSYQVSVGISSYLPQLSRHHFLSWHLLHLDKDILQMWVLCRLRANHSSRLTSSGKVSAGSVWAFIPISNMASTRLTSCPSQHPHLSWVLQSLQCRVYIYIYIYIYIIRQPLCPVVGRRPQHVVSKLLCLVLFSAISCRSSICPGRLSTVS